MQVQCILCDKVDTLNDSSYEAKRLLNKSTRSYLCSSCHERISINTKKRHETGKFKLYETKQDK